MESQFNPQKHAREKRKHDRFIAIAPNSRQVLIRDVWL
jgi:hypothetical protein